MDETVGQRTYSAAPQPFLGTPAGGVEASETTEREIDVAVRDIITKAFEQATAILRTRRTDLDDTMSTTNTWFCDAYASWQRGGSKTPTADYDACARRPVVLALPLFLPELDEQAGLVGTSGCSGRVSNGADEAGVGSGGDRSGSRGRPALQLRRMPVMGSARLSARRSRLAN
jgi:hypothetical protein